MTVREWQLQLRRQFGREQVKEFDIRNLGREPVFSEFAVTNPATKRTYRAVIRGLEAGVNYCSCPDYAVNTLGTCKHVEAVLGSLESRHAGALRRGYSPPFAEVYIRYGAQRAIVFSPGDGCPAELRKLAGRYFDREGDMKTGAIAGFDHFVQEARKFNYELRVYDDVAALIAEARDRQARRARLNKRYGGARQGATWGRLLKVALYPYQRERALFASMAGRSIIADEMGLGKTIQAIAAASVPSVVATPADAGTTVANGASGPANRLCRSGELAASPSASGDRTAEVQAMGDLLKQGAAFLDALGRSLVAPASTEPPLSGSARLSSQSTNGKGRGSAPAIRTNPDTGRRELHLPLLDEHVMRQWIELIGGVLGGLNLKPLTTRNDEQ